MQWLHTVLHPEDSGHAGASKQARRDRARTEHDIIEAVGAILERDGFRAVGVNAIAREAGVDKVLIYRYFGGMEGLMQAYAAEVRFWPSIDELAGYNDERVLSLPPRERVGLMLSNLATALSRRPATAQLLAWSLVEHNRVTADLEEARRAVVVGFLDRFVVPDAGRLSDSAIEAVLLTSDGVSSRIARATNLDERFWMGLEQAIRQLVSGLSGLGDS